MKIAEYIKNLKGESDDSPFFIDDDCNSKNIDVKSVISVLSEITFEARNITVNTDDRMLLNINYRKELP